jgi:predicted permease
MSIIKSIQNKPQSEKIKIMWIISTLVVILLIGVWIISYKFHKKIAPDTTLFKSIGQGVKDVKDNYGNK